MQIAVELGGGWVSKWTKKNLQYYDVVHIVEPFGPAMNNLLNEYKGLLRTGKVVCHLLGISDKREDKKIILMPIPGKTNDGGTPLYSMSGSTFKKRTEMDGHEAHYAKLVTWDEFIDEAKITHVDMAHVDIEGSEEELLRGMTKKLPKKMAFSIYHGGGFKACAGRRELVDMLEEKGYVVEGYITDDGKPSTFEEGQEALVCLANTVTATE